MSRKPPTSIDTEELLKIAETVSESEEVDTEVLDDDVLTFFNIFDIQPGEDKIKKNTLYSIYKVWSADPIKRTIFYAKSGQFLKTCYLNKSIAFLINQNAIKLTHAAFKEFKKENIRLKSKFWTKHAQNFLDYYLLKPGGFWLEKELLLYVYQKYVNELKINRTKAMREFIFFKYMDVFLPFKDTKDGKVYGLTDNIANQFEPKQLQRMRKSLEKEKNKKK